MQAGGRQFPPPGVTIGVPVDAVDEGSPWALRLIITALLVIIAYIYFSDREAKQQAPKKPTKEEEEQARLRRLERLEQSQQPQPPKRKAAGTNDKANGHTTSSQNESIHKKAAFKQTKPEDPLIQKTRTPASTSPPITSISTTKNSPAPPVVVAGAETKAKPAPGVQKKDPPKIIAKDVSSSNIFNKIDTTISAVPTTNTSAEEDSSIGAMKQKRSSPKQPQNPRSILSKALSSITGVNLQLGPITTSTSEDPVPKKTKPQTPKTTTILGANLFSCDQNELAWKELVEWLQNPSTKALQPLQSVLLSSVENQPASSNNYNNYNQYAPVKISDGSMYKAAKWYQDSGLWMRHNLSLLGKDGDTTEALQQCLQSFRAWIVSLVVAQWQEDIRNRVLTDNSSGNISEDDDDDLDLGIFADESYGGTSHALDQVNDNHKPNDKDDPKHKTLLEEFFVLLQDATCISILTKPFLADVMKVYDDQTTTTATTTSSLAMVLLQECLQRIPAPEHKAALEWDVTQKQLTALSNLLNMSTDVARALSGSILPSIDDKQITTWNGREWQDRAMLQSLLSLAAFTVPRFGKYAASAATTTTAQRGRNRQAYQDLLPHSFHNAMVASMGAEYPVCLYARAGGYEASLHSYHGTLKNARSIMKTARTVGTVAMKKIAAHSSSTNSSSIRSNKEMRKSGVLFDWISHILKAK